MRKNVSLTAPIEERAKEIIRLRGFTGLSNMIAVLVREEYERKIAQPPAALKESQKTEAAIKPGKGSSSYRRKRAKQSQKKPSYGSSDSILQ